MTRGTRVRTHECSRARSNCSQVTSLHVLSTFGSTVPRPRAADLTPCHLRRRPAFSSVHGGAARLLLLACLAPKQQYPILLHGLSQPPTQPPTYHPKPRQSCRQQGSTLLLSQEKIRTLKIRTSCRQQGSTLLLSQEKIRTPGPPSLRPEPPAASARNGSCAEGGQEPSAAPARREAPLSRQSGGATLVAGR